MTKPNFEAPAFDAPENQDNLGQNWKNKKRLRVAPEHITENTIDLSPDELLMRKEEGRIEKEGDPWIKIYPETDDYAQTKSELAMDAREKSNWEEMGLDKIVEKDPDDVERIKIKEVNIKKAIHPSKIHPLGQKETHVPKPPKFKRIRAIEADDVRDRNDSTDLEQAA